MAVYTVVPDEALPHFIASYDIGTLLSCAGIEEGTENSNYMLRTSADTYILTLYEKRVDARDLPFFLSLMEHLARKDIPCPLPVADRQGQTLKTLAGRPATLVSFLRGANVRHPHPEHCLAVGQMMAHMHVAACDFRIARPNALSVNSWRPLLNQCITAADRTWPGICDELIRELDFLERNWPTSLSKGVIHADLFPDNVLFIGNELSGLIDFYFASHDQLAYDMTVCINAWCFEDDNDFNIMKARALIKGYERIRHFDADEREALPILARGAAIRFLLTRLFDWLNGPRTARVTPKDPIEYLGKLRLLRNMNRPQDYGLDHD